MRVATSDWNSTFAVGYFDILGFINNGYGDGPRNRSAFHLSDDFKPTAVANYIIILFFLFPVVVMSVMCFLRIRVNVLTRRDKGRWGRREYLYRVHSLASASHAPVAAEISQPLSNGHPSRDVSDNSIQSSHKSSSDGDVEADIQST